MHLVEFINACFPLFCSQKLHLFDQKYSADSNIETFQFNLTTIFYIYTLKKINLFLWCKAVFSASLLQSSMTRSFRYHYNADLLHKKRWKLLNIIVTTVQFLVLFEE